MNWLINGEWGIVAEIGSGSSGKIYRATSLRRYNTLAAVKMEEIRPRSTSILGIEYAFYRRASGTFGFPRIFFYGKTACGGYRALVMTLLGSSLATLASRRTFSVKTVLMIGMQGLRRLEAIHNLGFIHGDIKPDNILIGYTDPKIIYITDFGKARRFLTSQNQHIRKGTDRSRILADLSLFASIKALKGKLMSRRDDLESFGYALVALHTGTLPWAGAGSYTRRVKEGTSISRLCKNCPSSFEEYFRYVRRLRFEEKPNYLYLANLFQESLSRRGYEDDGIFDWMSNR